MPPLNLPGQGGRATTRTLRTAKGAGADKKLIVSAQGPVVGEALTDDADNFLARMIDSYGIDKKQDSIDRWHECIDTTRKISREEHYEAIAFAYALYCKSLIAPTVRYAIAAEATKRGVEISKRKCPLRIALELCVTYHSGDDKAGFKASQKLYSRDTIAIRNLIDRGITPTEMVKLAREPNEGLDSWIRKSAIAKPDKANSRNGAAPTYHVIVEKRFEGKIVRLAVKEINQIEANRMVERLTDRHAK